MRGVGRPGKAYQSAKPPSALGTDYGGGGDRSPTGYKTEGPIMPGTPEAYDLGRGDIVIPTTESRGYGRKDIQNPIWTGGPPRRLDYPVSPYTNPFMTPEYGWQSSPTNPVIEDRPAQIPPGWSDTRGEHSRYRSPKMSDVVPATPDSHYPSQKVPDFTDNYNTYLNPDQEDKFQQWLQDNSKRRGYDLNKDLKDYDLRGAYLNNAKEADNGHLPDTYKKPSHPGFSDQSIYHGADNYYGGKWVQDPDDSSQWSYEPSQTTLGMHGESGVKSYLGQGNPYPPVQLILPKPPLSYDYSPVDHDPFYVEPQFTPVEHDPFQGVTPTIKVSPVLTPPQSALSPMFGFDYSDYSDLGAQAQGDQAPLAEPTTYSTYAPPVNLVQPRNY